MDHFEAVESHIRAVHARSRQAFHLPSAPPQAESGLPCTLCINQCCIPEGEYGFCGMRINRRGRLQGGGAGKGRYSAYYDPLPTNCVADWICAAGSACGSSQYSMGGKIGSGSKNLAVFFESCTFNCLFCQNWHFRRSLQESRFSEPDALARSVDDETSCICYFGGDPASQMLFALAASRCARNQNRDRILRICWETNGSMNRKLLLRAARLSLQSGGCIKIDLKAWHDSLQIALCGVSNRWTLANFEQVAALIPERPNPPLLVASTLLVPGYIDAEEVGCIAQFIAGLDPDIPYSLLGFFPQFFMQDLPVTSRRQAQECCQAALDAGLRRVRIGNEHLLGETY
jgi:pyruvate formate lyase activating enzyme